MTTNRFDSISRMFGQRLCRRSALRGTGAGLAGAALSAPMAFAVQDATPPAQVDPHPNAGSEQPELLFTQHFEAGTWAPKPGEDDVYTLTLTGAPAQTVYFSDRPDRVFGTYPMQFFLDTLGFGPDNPPNAALVAPIADSDEEEILIIELLNPRYDASTATLTYDARVLADYHEAGLSHAATRQRDYAFPATFDQGGLFIDGAPGTCKDINYVCQIDGNANIPPEPVGNAHLGQCYDWKDANCEDCSSRKSVCADEYPRQCLQSTTTEDGRPYDYYVCNTRTQGQEWFADD